MQQGNGSVAPGSIARWLAGLFVVGAALTSRGAVAQIAKPKVPPELVATYRKLADEIKPAALNATVQTLSAIPSRIAGYPGADNAANYVEQQFRGIGLENVRREGFNVTVPMVN